ncbi:MAG: hypothetical protein GY909_14810 [Oligoflexia bacterium]|nr:hypothetical protein [Oligoflexia bacterium]
MINNLICSTIYQEAAEYQEDFVKGLLSLNENNNNALLLLEENYELNDKLKNMLSERFETFIIKTETESNIISNRLHLIRKALNIDCENIIFTDSDDFLDPNALILHEESLANYDFSYGDQRLISFDGKRLNKTLFERHSVPETLDDITQLIQKNYCGLSALAFKKSSLKKLNLLEVPHSILALDWYIVTLALLFKLKGRKTSEPVVNYRQHINNNFAIDLEKKYEILVKKLRSAAAHTAAFSTEEHQIQLKKYKNCLNITQRNNEASRKLLKSYIPTAFPWFEDISKLSETIK